MFLTRFICAAAAVVLSLQAAVGANAAEKKEEVWLAVRILKGLDDSKDKAWAIETVRQAAEKDSSAFAMNALGVAYMHGIGVEKNDTLSTYWLEQAGAHGIHEAYHNLGLMYKNGKAGLTQDFQKACRYFKMGAENHSVMCAYDYGYMLYKGLGCRQDYAEAYHWFQKSATYDYSPALYMLGLCHRNGYGVERDDDRADFYLGRAAKLSFTDAMDELKRPEPENSWVIQHPEKDLQLESPISMPEVSAALMPQADLTGEYKGVIATYDWSGQNLINERPLSISVLHGDSLVQCRWCEGKDTVQTEAYVNEDGRLVFSKGTIRKQERYVEGGPVLFRFEDADISIAHGLITGRLRLYSMAHREPERPMYVTLQKANASGQEEEESGASGRIYAYPTPFAQQLTISFELAKDAPQAKALVYSQSGTNMANYSLGSLTAGRHTVTLSPTVPDGIYVLYVVAGSQTFQTIIVKKRGAL